MALKKDMSNMRFLQTVVLLALTLPALSFARPMPGAARTALTVLPMTCAELLPDMAPYLNFFEAVGRGAVATDRSFAKRIFKVLSLREKMVSAADRAREQNPVDVMIRKTLCFFREQREPLRVITYDDAAMVRFLHEAIGELESKVSDAIFVWEYDRQQRREYERALERNQGLVENVRDQADVAADRDFEKIANAAKKKVRSQ